MLSDLTCAIMSSEKVSKISKYRWKGKLCTEKQYKARLRQVEGGKMNSKSSISDRAKYEVEGRRIIEYEVMRKHMHCVFCKQLLSLDDVENEHRNGLGSIFLIRCRECLGINKIPTGKSHDNYQKQPVFDVNTKLAMGTLHAGLGFSSTTSLFQTMNIPTMSSRTFKKLEREVGPVVEIIAKESCKKAVALERALTIKNLENLQEKLPEDLRRSDFLVPQKEETCFHLPTISAECDAAIELMEVNPSSTSDKSETFILNEIKIPEHSEIIISSSDSDKTCALNSLPSSSLITATTKSNFEIMELTTSTTHHLEESVIREENGLEETNPLPIPVFNPASITSDTLLRLFVCFDMGWSKRGNGLQYDSLNGYATMIGASSGLVIDYITTSRKCRKCELGYAKNSHDCRLNFHGTAKAMEAHAAAQLAAKSEILKSSNSEIGVFISDNDSSSICAVRNATDHTVVKQSDRNHVSKGVKNLLYKTANNKDINGLTGDAINYLHRCYTYSVAQNEGNTKNMAAAIRNIPYHAFDIHENCGNWCGYLKDPENYKHSVLFHKDFKNEVLFKKICETFNKLAQNAEKFSCAASTQANESLNSMMSRKAPKAICYSTSESADYRFACTVSQKNCRQQYVQDVFTKMKLSPGSYLSKHIERSKKSFQLRSIKAKQPSFKARRQLLKKKRNQLRNAKERTEGDTYQSHIDLLTTSCVEVKPNSNLSQTFTSNLLQLSLDINFSHESLAIVFFDLETSGFQLDCDVLQIAVKCGNASFQKYITPTQVIPSRASNVHGLTNEGCNLYLHGNKVSSQPLRVVLHELLTFLTDLGKPCVLIAHNCFSFDGPRLVNIINKVSLQEEFIKVVDSFGDTMKLFRNKYPGADCSLLSLAGKNFSLSTRKAHDAIYDVILLQNIVSHDLNVDEILINKKNFQASVKFHENFQSLEPLQYCISKFIRTRMANATISYANLVDSYCVSKQTTIELLKKEGRDGKKVIRTKNNLIDILSHLKQALQ
ncbi:uncharacterized protein [Chelonus insularis]|uniref:uncharacterized protein n=1 Tax=Chelonus insularis TaxID=460826 RepID=UPI00158D21AD|nr:uncharacterized protein LOC118072850 [Chelonus insularis]